MPAATPQTAHRKMRSQSPPRLTHRRPVTYVQSAIAASSVRPYMWIVNGPTSSVPELGEGIEARRLTAAAFCRMPRLCQTLTAQLGDGRVGLVESREAHPREDGRGLRELDLAVVDDLEEVSPRVGEGERRRRGQ